MVTPFTKIYQYAGKCPAYFDVNTDFRMGQTCSPELRKKLPERSGWIENLERLFDIYKKVC